MYTVKDILDSKGGTVYSVSPDASVYDALKIMAGHNIGAVLVVQDNQIKGIFSERDYARKIILMGKTSKDSRIGDLMTDVIHTVLPTTTVNECMKLMTEHRVRHLPVLDNGIVGIISIGDVVNKTIQDQSNTINQLEDYIVGKR